MKLFPLLATLACVAAAPSAFAQSTPDAQRCLLEQLDKAAEGMTVAQLRTLCAIPAPAAQQAAADAGLEADKPAVVTRRLQEEAAEYGKRYSITAHRLNYILPITYDQRRPSSEPFANDLEEDARAQKIEMKYQFSFKVPLLLNAFDSGGSIFGGYTQRSFWQMYNNKASKPFRETNYEPEVWYQYPINMPVLGWNLVSASIGVNHQSNGRAKEYSRSWNRIMGGLVFERGEYAIQLRPWWRLRENSNDDDNGDIQHYLGYFDFALGRKFGSHSFDLMIRNNLKRRDNRGAFQVGWSFPLPINDRLRGYVQYFGGYGESLIDYNVRQNTLGVGLMLADW
ncbi:MAG: phospholipase A [Candidatus Dactylopiibacterium sp.]|nr:phospholipase A [Candidatus Dactylopiibacterium sp.]